MNILNRSVELINPPKYETLLSNVEQAARNCYRSHDKIKEGSAVGIIRALIKADHSAMLEFADLEFMITCDRGCANQIVRHRIGHSYAQESTRYCSYNKDIFNNSVNFIVPYDMNNELYETWRASCLTSEAAYFVLLEKGAKPETARSVLPHCLATHLVMKVNMRALRHFLKLRLDSHAQSDIRDIAYKMLDIVYTKYPVFVEDILYENRLDYIKWKFNIHKDEAFRFFAKNYMLYGNTVDNKELQDLIKNNTFIYNNKDVICCEMDVSKQIIENLIQAVLHGSLYISTSSACLD